MADLKTSEENTLTKSGFTANTVMRVADGSTGDNYKTPVLDFINAITLTSAQAVTLLGTPSDVVLDSLYKITTLGITGVDHVIISGRNMIQGNSAAECLVTGIGYVPCTYDVATNDIGDNYILYAATFDSSFNLIIEHTNISGETPTLTAAGSGIYDIQFVNPVLQTSEQCVPISGFNSPAIMYDGINNNSYVYEVTVHDIATGNPASLVNNIYIEIRVNFK